MAASYGRLVQIREEQPDDLAGVARVHADAFGRHGADVVSLVAALRDSLSREPGLSPVAVDGDALVGHVLFTRNLLDAPERLVDVQVLSPVGVLSGRQRQGVGTALIRRGIDVLAHRDVPVIFLEGSPSYYARFGFVAGHQQRYRRPSLRIPEAAFQALPLAAFRPWMTGTLVYRQAFWDHDAVGLRAGD